MTGGTEPFMKADMKRFVIAIIAVIAVSILWTIGWFYFAQGVRAEIEILAQGDGVTQPRLVCGDLAMGGFPFTFSPRCTNAELQIGDIAMTVPALSGTALFYRPGHIQVFATGPARIEDAFSGSVQEIGWSNLHASVRLDSGRLARFSAIADDLTHAEALFGHTIVGTATRAELHLIETTPGDAQPGTGAIYDFYALLDGAEAPAFAVREGRITLDGQVTGVPEPQAFGDPWLFAYWQALEGELTLRALEARTPDFSLAATGNAYVDETGRLSGALDVTSNGLIGPLSALADPAMVEIFLGSPDAEGVSRQNIAINSGTIYIGIIPVLALPPLF